MLASRFFRVVLLPLGLSLGVVLGLGCFTETNDDQHFAFLFRGVTAAGPVPALPLYFHGLGRGLSTLYTAWPVLPWLGLVLAALLAAATVLAFAVLDKLLRPHLRPSVLVLALVVFFLLAWLEHWLWFSHLRVAMLLAGGALLFAAQRPRRAAGWALCLGGLVLAWAIRPSAAGLAVLAAAPAAVLLAGTWRRAWPVLLGAVATLGLASLLLSLAQGPTEARFRALDSRLAAVLDYGLLQPRPRTRADSLTVAAVDQWLLGDTALVNEASLRRAYVVDVPHFLARVLPGKLATRLALLARDYFPVLLALLAAACWAGRRRENRRVILLIQLGLGGLLLGLAALLKLPPRLALPLLDFWLLANLAAGLAGAECSADGARAQAVGNAEGYVRFRRLALGISGIVCLIYSAKIWHRRHVLRQEQSRHERALREIAEKTSGRIRVLAGADEQLKSLSPFRSYSLGPGPVLWLSGWPARDPSQLALYRQLTGSADLILLRLARKPSPEVTWVLSTPTAGWLNQSLARYRAHMPDGWREDWQLQPGPRLLADSTLRLYNIEPKVRVYNQQTDLAKPNAARRRR